MHKVTFDQLEKASLKDLEMHIEKLEMDIDNLDYFFSVFLGSMGTNDMSSLSTNTPEWILYRKMNDIYEEQDARLRAARYQYNFG